MQTEQHIHAIETDEDGPRSATTSSQQEQQQQQQQRMRLHGVSRTLLIPLWARAVESKKARPIVDDPRAREIVDAIAERKDFDFSSMRHAYGTQLGCVVRGLLYDQWVNDFQRVHPTGTIVELGCGLTTRFERIDRGLGKARWVDIDLPDVIAVRRRAFSSFSAVAVTRRLDIAMSVTDKAWITTLERCASPPYFFVSEGMLMYLAPSEVEALFSRMAKSFSGSMMAFDSIAPVIVKNQHHHDSMKHMMDAPFKWGIDDARLVEDWSPNLMVREIANLAEIALRFPDRVPRRHRALAKAITLLAPWLARSYRLARVEFT